jgi:hypothetical protein
MKRRRSISRVSFTEKLTGEANRLKQRLKETHPENDEREVLLGKLRQIETAVQIEGWIRAPNCNHRNNPD